MKRITRLAVSALACAAVSLAVAPPAAAVVRGKPVEGLALYGEPMYGPGFKNFDYVNVEAPKGGTLRLEAVGTFDSLNSFINKGTPAAGLNYMGNSSYFYFFESLMARGANEPETSYCLICQTVEVAPDNKSETFKLRPEAKFQDGSPVTADDVVFSFDTLMKSGAPMYRLYWGDVEKAVKIDARTVRFDFKTADNTELPIIVGELPILSKAFWSKRDFTQGTLDIPVSTGAYHIDSFEPGRFIVYKRDPNYWGKDLPINRGAYNFDQVRFDYYRDEDVDFEAFKAHQYDLRIENLIARWANGYDADLVNRKLIVKEAFQDGQPHSAQAFVVNLRRPKFADRRVREALAYAFDFDASNKTLAFGLMDPFTSFFQGSDLAPSGVPQGEELKILDKYRGRIPDEVFTTPFSPPRTDGTGNNRANLLKARDLLTAAGWEIRNGVLTNKTTGEPFQFEFLTAQAGLEKWVVPYFQNLQRLGIKGQFRVIDPTQFINRITNYDFDMTLGGPPQGNSPGNEQRDNWGTAAADRPGSRNWSGIKDPVVDQIIEDLILADTREKLVTYTHALDRVLVWNYYLLPEFTVPAIWMAHWDKFDRPQKTPLIGLVMETWWFDTQKAAKVEAGRTSK